MRRVACKRWLQPTTDKKDNTTLEISHKNEPGIPHYGVQNDRSPLPPKNEKKFWFRWYFLHLSVRNKKMKTFTSHPTSAAKFTSGQILHIESLVSWVKDVPPFWKMNMPVNYTNFYEHTFHQGPWQGSTLSKHIIFLVYSHFSVIKGHTWSENESVGVTKSTQLWIAERQNAFLEVHVKHKSVNYQRISIDELVKIFVPFQQQICWNVQREKSFPCNFHESCLYKSNNISKFYLNKNKMYDKIN